MDSKEDFLKKIVSILNENDPDRLGEKSMGDTYGKDFLLSNRYQRLDGWKSLYLNDHRLLLIYMTEFLHSKSYLEDKD